MKFTCHPVGPMLAQSGNSAFVLIGDEGAFVARRTKSWKTGQNKPHLVCWRLVRTGLRDRKTCYSVGDGYIFKDGILAVWSKTYAKRQKRLGKKMQAWVVGRAQLPEGSLLCRLCHGQKLVACQTCKMAGTTESTFGMLWRATSAGVQAGLQIRALDLRGAVKSYESGTTTIPCETCRGRLITTCSVCGGTSYDNEKKAVWEQKYHEYKRKRLIVFSISAVVILLSVGGLWVCWNKYFRHARGTQN